MNYYKIVRGYNAEDYIEIDETELDKSFYAFLTKKDSVYSGGAVRGSEIIAIQPDNHRMMKWNRGYKLTALDYEELNSKGIDRDCKLQLSHSKEKVTYLIKVNKPELLGKDIPELPQRRDTEGLKSIGEVVSGGVDN